MTNPVFNQEGEDWWTVLNEPITVTELDSLMSHPVLGPILTEFLHRQGVVANPSSFERILDREGPKHSTPIAYEKRSGFLHVFRSKNDIQIQIEFWDAPTGPLDEKYIERIDCFKTGRSAGCVDCGNRRFQWFMVNDDIWFEAWPDVAQTKVRAAAYLNCSPSQISCLLCLPCLEQRIGRLIRAEDLKNVVLNRELRASLLKIEALASIGDDPKVH